MDHAIVLFDGYCNFCCRTVNFIIRRDPDGYFQFAAMQLEKGQALLREYSLEAIDTIVLIEEGRVYIHSTAVLRIMRRLRGLWKLLYAFIVVPRIIRDYLYKLFARYRHHILGKSAHCRIPTEEERARFL